MLLALWSPKGGSGTSVVAAAIALVLAGRGPTRLADLAGDQPAILGLPPEPTAGLAGWLAGGPGVPSEALDRLVLDVVPGLALLPLVARASGVVLVEEPGRALGEREVVEVLGLPVLGRFPVRASVARAVDAGVLAARLPSPLSGPAVEVLDALSPRLVAGRAA